MEGNDFCHLVIIKIISLTLDPSLEVQTNYLGACRIPILGGCAWGKDKVVKYPEFMLNLGEDKKKKFSYSWGRVN